MRVALDDHPSSASNADCADCCAERPLLQARMSVRLAALDLFNHEHRRLVCVVVSDRNHA